MPDIYTTQVKLSFLVPLNEVARVKKVLEDALGRVPLSAIAKVSGQKAAAGEKITGGKEGGILGVLGRMSIGIFAIGALLASVISNLAPVKAVMKILEIILTLVLMPIAMLLFYILGPSLVDIAKLLAATNKLLTPYLKEVQERGIDLSNILGGVDDRAIEIVNGVMQLPQKIIELKDKLLEFKNSAEDFLSDIPEKIVNLATDIGKWFTELPGNLWTSIQTGFNWVTEKLVGIWNSIIDKTKEIWDNITNLPGGIWEKMKALPGDIWTLIQEGFNWVVEKVGSVINGITSLPENIWTKVQGLAEMIAAAIKKLFGFGQFGGTVTATGPYILHKGENVIPAGKSLTTTFNFSGAIFNSGVDVEDAIARANRVYELEMRRNGFI